MIDVYGIGLTLKLNDLVGAQLFKLAEQFEKLDLLAASLNKSLKGISANASGLKALNIEAGQFDVKLERANQQAILLERNLRGLKAAGVMPGIGGTIPGALPGAGGSGGRNGHRGGLHGGNIHAGTGGFGIGSVGMGLGSNAMVPLAAGAVGLYMIHSLYDEAKKLEKVKADFANLNLSQADNDSVLSKSWSLTNSVRGSNVTENMALIQDLHTATGDLHHALDLADPYTKFAAAAKMQNNGQNVDGLVLNSIKALEHRGDRVLQDDAERDKELRMQSQVDFFTRGVVSPSDYFGMSRTGKLAYQLASPEYLYGPAAALISANSGATAGTMEMTALSSLVGGHMDKKAKGFLSGIGLWSDTVDPQVAALRQKFEKDSQYQAIVAANGGSLIQNGGLSGANSKLFVEDRNKFVLDVLMPAIKSKYGLDMSNEDVGRLLSANFNRNTAGDLSFFVTNQQKVAKDTAGIRKANDYTGAYANYMEKPIGAEENFTAAWANFKTEFGKSALPAITSMLNGGAELLRDITSFTQANGTLVAEIGKMQKSVLAHGVAGGIANYLFDAAREGGKALLGGSTASTGLPTVASASPAAVGKPQGDVYLDGKKVGMVLEPIFAKSMSKPPTGPNFFDGSMSVRPVGGRIG